MLEHGLRGIAERHAADVDGILAGISGSTAELWTSTFRAVVRKDDPPEEDEAE